MKTCRTLKTFIALFVLFSSKKSSGFGGMFGMLKGLVGSKSLTQEDMEPALDKMRDHLIGKRLHESLTRLDSARCEGSIFVLFVPFYS